MSATGWTTGLPQQASPATDRSGGSAGADSILDLASQPGVVEALLAAAVIAALWLVWWRLASLVRCASSRRALRDYLLGVEQALQGDLKGAQKRLSKVLEQDPENHYARLQLGKVLGELGRNEEAHQHHLYLQTAFAVESLENELLLARSLLEAQLPQEAAAIAERSLQRAPSNAPACRLLYRARLQLGDANGAASAGRRLLDSLNDNEERRRFRAELAQGWVTAGTQAWRANDRKRAAAAAREARLLGAAPQLPLLEARLRSQEKGLVAVATELAQASHPGALVPAVSDPVTESTAPAALPVATFAGLLAPSRWTCGACEAPLESEVFQCRRCGATGTAELVEPALVAPIDSATQAMDRIDVNDAHLRRLVRDVLDGRPGARDEVAALQDAAVPELLRAGWRAEGSARERAVEALRSLGPEVLPALFRAAEEASAARILPVGEGPEALVAATVQGWGAAALPFIEPLFHSQRPGQVRVLVDYFLSLGDVTAFQSVLERVPPMEILHRLNQADAPVLERFLQAVPRGHFLAESMLLEPTFYRDEALLAAVDGAAEPDVLIEVMLRRGPTRSLVTALIAATAAPRLSEHATRVLRELGAPVLEHCLAAFSNPDVDEAARRPLADVLVRGGAAAAACIADGFGPAPSASDDRLRALLCAIGDDAVEALLTAYERSGWLEKVSAGLVSRHNNRRVQILRALGELGSPAARDALAALAAAERDDNLRIQLQRALHDAGGDDA